MSKVCMNRGEPIISPKQPSLLPCPSCGGEAHHIDDGIGCKDICRCDMRGPVDDPTGSKWNALPRRDENPGYCEGFEDGSETAHILATAKERQRWIAAVRGEMDEYAPGRIKSAIRCVLIRMGVSDE